jgi:carboxynorspermidine decarboxylase
LFPPEVAPDPLVEAVALLKRKYGVEVFVEPGSGMVREAGSLVATVVDLFERDGRRIAVLDASVNHLPEVFEYQFHLDVAGEVEESPHRYLLAGASCLAGDLFGEYCLDAPLEVGRKVVFEDAGAYSVVKAHQFNGINLPSIYLWEPDGTMKLIKTFDYPDFVSRCGGDKHAVD